MQVEKVQIVSVEGGVDTVKSAVDSRYNGFSFLTYQ